MIRVRYFLGAVALWTLAMSSGCAMQTGDPGSADDTSTEASHAAQGDDPAAAHPEAVDGVENRDVAPAGEPGAAESQQVPANSVRTHRDTDSIGGGPSQENPNPQPWANRKPPPPKVTTDEVLPGNLGQ